MENSCSDGRACGKSLRIVCADGGDGLYGRRASGRCLRFRTRDLPRSSVLLRLLLLKLENGGADVLRTEADRAYLSLFGLARAASGA